MKLSPTVLLFSLAGITLLVPAAVARAEFPRPQLNAILPPGGQRGTSVEAKVVGTDLDDLASLRFSHPGIVAKPLLTSPTEFDPEPKPVAGKMTIQIAPDVPPGLYDAVATGRFGVTNPRLFMVGSVAEVTPRDGIGGLATAPEVPLDATVAGMATANAADHYALTLAAGQRVRLDVWARRIDSRLTPTLEVLDAGGRVLARARRSHDDDPCLDFVAGVAGRHVVRVHDMYMGGGEMMPYRLLVSTGPAVEGVFPPVAAAGETARLTAIGRGLVSAGQPGNDELEETTVDVDIDDASGNAGGRFTSRLFAVRDLSADLLDVAGGVPGTPIVPPTVLASAEQVTLEQEPNDDPARPQTITLPNVVAGRFDPRGDRDWFGFDAKAGEEWVFDLYSRRLGLPTDASLLIESLTKAADGTVTAKEVAFADDGPAEFQGGILDRPGFDPSITFKAPADGSYRLLVRELAADSRGGIDRAWVLGARRPDPRFRLVVPLAQPDRADPNKLARAVPSLPIGGRVVVDVFVVRLGGFTGDVTLEPQGLPAGVTAAPTVIPARSNRGMLVLTAADGTPPFTGSFRVLGRGRVGERDLDATARVATLVWNVDDANTPFVMRESTDIPLAVTVDAAPITVAAKEQKSWETQPGGKLEVPVDVVHRPGAKGPVAFTAAGLPAELKVAELKIDEKAADGKVEITTDAKLPPGTYTVVLKGVAKLAYARDPQAAERARADADRITSLAKDRAARVVAAKEAVAAAQAKQQSDPQVAAEVGKELAKELETATEAVKVAEAAAKAAETERSRREEAAKAAATAAAPKDIDVPVVVAPITIVVAVPKPAEPPKQPEQPKP
jgi:hypothetical protein